MDVSTRALVAESWRRTCVIGHRGSAATHPENSFEAFEEGIACGADAIECDVHMSRDGHVVVMHDDTLDRTTTLRGAVAESESEPLRAAGIPFLPELCASTRDRSVLVIELKGGTELERSVAAHLEERGMADQAILFSFNADYLSSLDRHYPHLFTTYLIGEILEPKDMNELFDSLKKMGADGVGTDYRNCPPELVREAQDRGMPIFVWTVPPGAEDEKLIKLNVNFIITDHPREVVTNLTP